MLHCLRLIKIISVALSLRLDDLIPWKKIPWWWRWPLHCAPWRLFRSDDTQPVRLRIALEKLGPIFVKFGQLLSTRHDFVPKNFIEELSKLQEQVPPFSTTLAIALIEKDLHHPIDVLFRTFEQHPLASASIAQVHAAVLHTGEHVVVKVVRPDIKKVIGRDIHLLRWIARCLMVISYDARRLRLLDLVAEYEKTLINELDMHREAANASQLRRNFYHSNDIYVPDIYWDYCGNNVLVMERVAGIPINNRAALLAKGVDIKRLAERAVIIFFTQVFRDGFFHADMHPGNIFVNADIASKPYFITLDFGIIGTLSPEDQSYLARNFVAFFRRDYRKIAELHVRSGWVPSSTPIHELESVVRTVCEPIFGQPLSKISFAHVLLNLFTAARKFNMEVQPQLVLLEKTLLNVEGIGYQLYPELNLWETAQPFLERWLKRRITPLALYKAFSCQYPDWIEQMPIWLHRITQPCALSSKHTKKHPFLQFSGTFFLGLLFIFFALFLKWPGGWQCDVAWMGMIIGSLGIVLLIKGWCSH